MYFTMQRNQAGSLEGVECNVLSLRYLSREAQRFLWVKSSAQQDTFAACHENGSFSVLKIKDKNLVSNFVLDPNLQRVYWDFEETSALRQLLYAQTVSGDVLLYAVDDEGVTETLHISQSKLVNSIKSAQSNRSEDAAGEKLELVGCDRGQIFLHWNLCLFGLQTPASGSNGSSHLKCTIPLPQAATPETQCLPQASSKIAVSTYQIVNGSVVIFDHQANRIDMYSASLGSCIYQMDLLPLGVDVKNILDWRMSYDLSVLMLLLTDWRVIQVNVSVYFSHHSTYVNLLDFRGEDQAFDHEYLSYNLCRYGDNCWKQEVVSQHIFQSQVNLKRPKTSPALKRPIGFKLNKRQNQKKSKEPESHAASYMQILQMEEEERKKNWKLETVDASSDVLTLVLKRSMPLGRSGYSKAICFVNFEDQAVQLHHLSEMTSVVLSNSPTCSHILISDKCLMFISPQTKLQKDDLITWMMSYSGPNAADSLCQANQWTRTAVPLQALESSLQQRQLDTLAFFFKSKQGLFSAAVQNYTSAMLTNDMRQVEASVRLVITTVQACMADTQAKMFAERLLSVTLDFVYGLLEDARLVLQSREQQNRTNERNRGIEESCQALLTHIPALRKCMRVLQCRGSQNVTPNKTMSVSRAQKEQSEPIVEVYLKENKLSKLQSVLLADEKNRKLHYRELVVEMLDLVKGHLQRKDISACQHILNNLGCDVSSTLWSLAQFYAGRSLQQFITSELSTAAALSPAKRQIVQYLEQLYNAYPNKCFSSTMKYKVHDQTGKVWPDKDDPLKETVFASGLFLLSYCGEFAQGSRSDSTDQQESDLYSAILLAWLARWTEEMKQAVMMDAHFLAQNDAKTALKSDPSTTWQFIISHNLLDIAMSLVESVSKEKDVSLPGDVTTYLHLGWSHLKKEIARELIRQEKLNLDALDFQGIDLDSMLVLLGGPLKSPHPLSYAGSIHLNTFHTDFLSHCVSADLQLPFWMYCAVHNIKPSEIQICQKCSWLPQFQTLYFIPRHPTDKNLMLSASLMAAADLWSFSSGEMTIQMMLEKNQILAAVGTLSYMTEENLNLDAAVVEKNLCKFPKLMAALLPEGQGTSAKENTTVYQLLMGTTRFDLRRLFGWHSTNSYAREESPSVMPHFSEPIIIGFTSRQRKLAFPYYLKHGRPVFAFLSFLAEELDRRDSMLSQKRIQQACGAALWIACQNFNTPYISSACVVFVELLGRDSSLVRTMIHSGRVLLARRHRNVGGRAEARKDHLRTCGTETVSDLQACVRSQQRHGHKLISLLEVAIREEIKLEGIGSCSFEASQKWMLVVMLCKLLSLPLSTCFLMACAEADNWLLFVWFSQLHQYPTHQLQTLMHSFRSPSLRDHLHYVLNNADSKLFTLSSSSSSSSNSSSGRHRSSDTKTSHSQRTSLYSRIGVQQSKADSSSDEEDNKNKIVISSFSSRLHQNEFNESEIPESSAPDDVFRMLFHSSSMPSQWKCLLSAAVTLRNPLFAELAACCGCPAIPGLCGWLLASLSSDVKQRFLNLHGQMVSRWTAEHLEELIDVTLSCGQEDNLSTAFIILQPKSPLLPFLCFVTDCVKRGIFAACKTYMDQFKEAMATCDNQKSLADKRSTSDVPTIGDRAWFEKIAHQVITHELRVVSSLYKAKHLLEILDRHNICLVFSFDVQDFSLLHKVITILHTHSVPGINLALLLTDDVGSQAFVQECDKAVDYLISCGEFSAAQELAKAAGINREKVTLSQLKEEKQQLKTCGVWTAKFVRSQYWDKCRKLMLQAKCSPEACAQFFKSELEQTSLAHEKAILCQHWYSLLEDHAEPEVVAIRDLIFRDMWRHHIAAKVADEEMEQFDEVFDIVTPTTDTYSDLKSDLVEVATSQHDESDIHEDLTAQELEVLDSLIGNYLDQGRVSSCSEVAAVFGHYNQDLAIIQTCIALALKQCTIENIEPAMKRLVSRSSNKRNRTASLTFNRTYSFTSFTNTESEQPVSDPQEITAVIEKLYAHCIKGSSVCLQVITCFKIAEILGMEYKDVVMNSEFDSLRKLLRISHPNKFAVARDFLATSRLSDDEVAGFLADSIVDVLRMFVKGNDEDVDGADDDSSQLMFNLSDGMAVFSQFMKLCENTALLGDHILQAVASLLTTGLQVMSAKVLTMQTELIIMAHECYTISSNMEGISHVLRAARVCSDCLAEAGEYTLMIRLLTGVGRYSEMLYIFHSLQQHHQFELLLRKGMDRENRLKVAILDYLKRYQPDDNEAYTMVALKFTMYRDIAAMLEACGHKSLKLLKDKALDSSKDTQELLNKCLQYFQDAAESYVKDNSVRKAQHCVKLARLLSLQMQLLSQGVNVINLSREQVIAFTNNHPRFIEAMVVSDAYERRADWTEAILNNVVLNGDLRYLQEMKLHVHITSSVVEDVVKKYKQVTVKPSGALTAIRKLLVLSKDVQLQYRLASELGLTDMVTSLLKGDTGCYLQDVTVIQ